MQKLDFILMEGDWYLRGEMSVMKGEIRVVELTLIVGRGDCRF